MGSKKTRYLDIRYFFLSDMQKHKHITSEYCATGEMIGNFFTNM